MCLSVSPPVHRGFPCDHYHDLIGQSQVAWDPSGHIQTCSYGEIQGVCIRGEGGSASGGVALHTGGLGMRAVRILLECFLVMSRVRTWWNFRYFIFLFLVLHLLNICLSVLTRRTASSPSISFHGTLRSKIQLNE